MWALGCVLAVALALVLCPVATAVGDAAGTYALSFEINGRGTLSWTVDGMPCDERCREELKTGASRVAAGASVEFTAAAEPGWALDRWTNCAAASGDASVCRLTMTQDLTVGATFRPSGPPVLRPEISGQTVWR